MSGIQSVTVKYQKDDSVGIVILNRPEVLNALNKAVFEELGFVFDKIARDEDVKAVIITGAGKAFAAGADIEAMRDLSPLEARQFALAAYKTQEKISTLPKPTIAAIKWLRPWRGLRTGYVLRPADCF